MPAWLAHLLGILELDVRPLALVHRRHERVLGCRGGRLGGRGRVCPAAEADDGADEADNEQAGKQRGIRRGCGRVVLEAGASRRRSRSEQRGGRHSRRGAGGEESRGVLRGRELVRANRVRRHHNVGRALAERVIIDRKAQRVVALIHRDDGHRAVRSLEGRGVKVRFLGNVRLEAELFVAIGRRRTHGEVGRESRLVAAHQVKDLRRVANLLARERLRNGVCRAGVEADRGTGGGDLGEAAAVVRDEL
mmetsp:Transcript_22106/g.56473  ORF Transcript_22106/g.56473 Transcript_22106/m.56473 type:complete len:249 (-) Transcript_22106:265-1011(-)